MRASCGEHRPQHPKLQSWICRTNNAALCRPRGEMQLSIIVWPWRNQPPGLHFQLEIQRSADMIA